MSSTSAPKLRQSSKASEIGAWEFDVTRNEFRFSKQKAQPHDRGKWHKLSAWKARLHPKDLPFVTDKISRVFSGKAENIDTIHRVRSNDRSWRWVRIQGKVAQRDRNGDPCRLTGVISASAMAPDRDAELNTTSSPPPPTTTKTNRITKSVKTNEGGRSRSILLVDDNTAGAQMMSMLLTLEGFTVFLATTGLEAVQLFKETQPSFVLLDIGLPDIDGHAVAKSIRAIQGPTRPTIIALTGWGSERDRELSRKAGCDVHLTKPVDFDELEKLLKERAGHGAVNSHTR